MSLIDIKIILGIIAAVLIMGSLVAAAGWGFSQYLRIYFKPLLSVISDSRIKIGFSEASLIGKWDDRMVEIVVGIEPRYVLNLPFSTIEVYSHRVSFDSNSVVVDSVVLISRRDILTNVGNKILNMNIPIGKGSKDIRILKEAKTEDVQFDKNYNILADSQEGAEKLLTPRNKEIIQYIFRRKDIVSLQINPAFVKIEKHPRFGIMAFGLKRDLDPSKIIELLTELNNITI